MKRLKEILEKIEAPTILDIGTGSGQFVSMITGVCGHYKKIVGIDTLDRAIDAANKNNSNDRITFKVQDVMTMDEKFDIVCLSNSLHHFENPKAIIDKMIDLTYSGGKIIIQEMYQDHQTDAQMSHVKLHHFWAEVDRLTGNIHNDTFFKNDIIGHLSHDKLKLVDVWDVDFGEKYVYTSEDYDFLKSSIYNSLKKIESLNEYATLKKTGENLDKRLDEVGFDSATELMIVSEKC